MDLVDHLGVSIGYFAAWSSTDGLQGMVFVADRNWTGKKGEQHQMTSVFVVPGNGIAEGIVWILKNCSH